MITKTEKSGRLKVMPAKEFQEANLHIWENYAQLMWLLRHRHKNGLTASGAVLQAKNGDRGKLLVDPNRFMDWLRQKDQEET